MYYSGKKKSSVFFLIIRLARSIVNYELGDGQMKMHSAQLPIPSYSDVWYCAPYMDIFIKKGLIKSFSSI